MDRAFVVRAGLVVNSLSGAFDVRARQGLFRTGGMAGIPGACQAMERREVLKFMVDTRKERRARERREAAPGLGCSCSYSSRGEEARMTDDRVPLATVQDECVRLGAPGVEVLLDVSRGYP